MAWGPGREAGDEETWAAWLAAQPNRTVVGMDANAPKVDHPDIDKNTYWGDEYGFDYQCERLLFDPSHAPQRLLARHSGD